MIAPTSYHSRAMGNRNLRVGGVILLGALLVPDAVAFMSASPVAVQPTEYVSPRATCRFHVAPSQRNGAGAAGYRLSCEGAAGWAGEHPYTFLDAAVSDDGWVAGYAYSFGDESWLNWERHDFKTEQHDVRLVVFDPSGRERVVHQEAVRFVYYEDDTDPVPHVSGLLFDFERDRLVLRVLNGRSVESWWPFRVSDGEALPHVDPQGQGSYEHGWFRNASVVFGTPLTLAQLERRGNEPRCRFALIETDSGSTVWTCDAPGDECSPEAVTIGANSAFEIRLGQTSERVTFRIAPGESELPVWQVHEVGRHAWVQPTPVPDPFDGLPMPEAEKLGEIVLTGDKPSPFPHIHGVQSFDIDDRGRFGFLRDGALVLLGKHGALLHEVRLDAADQRAHVSAAWAADDRWVVIVNSADQARAFFVDAPSGKVTALATFADVEITDVAGRRGHGFAALTKQKPTVAGAKPVWRTWLFDVTGKRAGELAGEVYPHLWPGVELSGGQRVVKGEMDTLAVFDKRGQRSHSISLETAWKRKPESVHEIGPDSDGGVIVNESRWLEGKQQLHRMRADGSVRAVLDARYSDGSRIFDVSSPQSDSKGRIWISDGESLLRLGDDGKVVDVLGPETSGLTLGHLIDAKVDGMGRIHALDRRTAVLHTFDREGHHLGTCTPGRTGLFDGGLVIGHNGEVWIPDGSQEPVYGRFLDCSDATRRTIEIPPRLSPIHLLSAHSFWSEGLMQLELVENDHVQLIQRGADGRWLDWIGATAMAPDGSVAAEAPHSFGPPIPRTLNLFDRDGTPRRMFHLPASCPGRLFAYDGERLFLWNAGEVRVLDTEGRPLQRFRLAVAGARGHDPLLPQLAPDNEIWLIERDKRRVHRFERPELTRIGE